MSPIDWLEYGGTFALGVLAYFLIDKWLERRAAKKAKRAPPPF